MRLSLLLPLGIFSIGLSLGAAAADETLAKKPQCSIRLLTEECKPFSEGGEILDRTPDGRIFVNIGRVIEKITQNNGKTPLDPGLQDWNVPNPQFEREGQAVFNEVLAHAIQDLGEEIRADSPEDRLLRRLKSLTYLPLRPGTPAFKRDCIQGKTPWPGANYQPWGHRIEVCPGFLSSPLSFIRASLAHEIAHAVDPCNSMEPLYRLMNPGMIGTSIGLDPADTDVRMASAPGVGANNSMDTALSWEEVLGAATASKLAALEVPALTKATYPYAELARCLAKQSTPVKELAYLGKANAWVRDRRQCESTLPEDFADRLAAHWIGTLDRSPTPMSRMDRLALVSFFSSPACVSPERRNEGHSSGDRRMATWLNDGGMARQLGCTPPGKECAVKLGHSFVGAKATPSETTRAGQ